MYSSCMTNTDAESTTLEIPKLEFYNTKGGGGLGRPRIKFTRLEEPTTSSTVFYIPQLLLKSSLIRAFDSTCHRHIITHQQVMSTLIEIFIIPEFVSKCYLGDINGVPPRGYNGKITVF